jgi:hypothetical protein
MSKKRKHDEEEDEGEAVFDVSDCQAALDLYVTQRVC